MTNELYHHGVKGQKWGHRNGPPYPLYRKTAYYKKTDEKPPGHIGSSNKINDLEREEKRKKILKRIAIGTGAAAGIALGAYAGRNIYMKNKKIGEEITKNAAKNLNNTFKKNKAVEKEASNIASELNRQRNKFASGRLNMQAEYNNLAGKKGIRSAIKRHKMKKSMKDLDAKMAANAASASRNKWAADEEKVRLAYARREFKDAKNTAAALERAGKKKGIAAGLGISAAGITSGYGANELLGKRRSKKKRRR